MNTSNEIVQLENLCAPLVEYLKKNRHPYSKIIVSENSIKLVSTEISIPINDKAAIV